MRARRRRRGGGFLLFILVLLPMMMIGVALVSDYATSILAHRHVATAGDSVAMAAATAYSSADPRILDQSLARTRAQEMFTAARSSGMLPRGRFADVTLQSVTFPTSSQVRIEIRYRTPSLFISSVLTGQGISVSGRIVRTAQICVGGGTATQPCAYPT